MIMQIKKATWETSKNMIYSADGDLPKSYEAWKVRLLRMDLNWCLKQAEGIVARCNDSQAAGKRDYAPEGWSNVEHPWEEDSNRNNIRGARHANGYQRSQGNSKVFPMWQDRPLQTRLPQCA